MTSIDVAAFALPRAGNRDSEWEDAGSYSVNAGRFAIGDGASAAYRSGWWCHLLTKGFVRDPFALDDPDALRSWLSRRAEEWDGSALPDDAPYYVREAAARGSHATLLCLAIDEAAGTWQALAVGDSCLFQIRDGALLRSFPIDDAAAFDLHPALVHTAAAARGEVPGVARLSEPIVEGDVLLAATDALSQWALAAHAERPDVWSALVDLDQEAFTELVSTQRDAGQLSNDDVTLLRCRFDGNGS